MFMLLIVSQAVAPFNPRPLLQSLYVALFTRPSTTTTLRTH